MLQKDFDARIQILSVDSAQGHEYPAVVLSCVADGKKPGFTKNPHRLCVALSRAQQHLTVVAQPSLVKRIGVLGRIQKAIDLHS